MWGKVFTLALMNHFRPGPVENINFDILQILFNSLYYAPSVFCFYNWACVRELVP